jgi:hypothetical protein
MSCGIPDPGFLRLVIDYPEREVRIAQSSARLVRVFGDHGVPPYGHLVAVTRTEDEPESANGFRGS